MVNSTFGEILEAADQLPLEDQENLREILANRIRERRRHEIIKDLKESQQELREGNCKVVTPEQLMEEILS